MRTWRLRYYSRNEKRNRGHLLLDSVGQLDKGEKETLFLQVSYMLRYLSCNFMHILKRGRRLWFFRFLIATLLGRSGNLTLEALESAVLAKFNSLKHVPIWKQERPESIRGGELKVYRIYPVGLTQRQALYTFRFKGNADFRGHIESNPCSKFEVIFV